MRPHIPPILVISLVLSGCGIRGSLDRPPPIFSKSGNVEQVTDEPDIVDAGEPLIEDEDVTDPGKEDEPFYGPEGIGEDF